MTQKPYTPAEAPMTSLVDRAAVEAALRALRRKDVSGEPRMELSTDWFNSGVSACLAAIRALPDVDGHRVAVIIRKLGGRDE